MALTNYMREVGRLKCIHEEEASSLFLQLKYFFTHAKELVKFSSEPDLNEEECQQLLQQYMPDHVRSTKITQRLFIK